MPIPAPKSGVTEEKSRRELGQNLLKYKRVAKRIVAESGVVKGELVVELGAGGGILTRQLARVSARVVEYDSYWAMQLKERFSDDDNVRVVQGEALSLGPPKEPLVVVGNVPFNATTSILHRLLDDRTSPLQSAHLLVQKQLALEVPVDALLPARGESGVASTTRRLPRTGKRGSSVERCSATLKPPSV